MFTALFQNKMQSIYAKVKEAFPPNTRRGQLMRFVMKFLRNAGFGRQRAFVQITDYENGKPLITESLIPKCDILVQVDNFEAGGLENITLDINEALHEAGYKIVLLILGKAGISVQKAIEHNANYVVLGNHDIELYERFLKQLQPKLILAHYSIYGVEICKKLNIPFVQTLQNTYMWFDEKQLEDFKHAANYTKMFIALSDFVKNYSVCRLGVDENKCLVLPCGVNLHQFEEMDWGSSRHELRNRHGIDKKAFVFLSVGSINHQKNHIATVRAFSRISEAMPNAKLVILGPAYEIDLLSKIEKFVTENNLQENVIYAGAANDAVQYYFMADAFVSAAFFEGGPLVLLEALNANLPIIATRVGLAERFADKPGVQLIEPPINLIEYHGTLQALESNSLFEEALANTMFSTYKLPLRPNLSDEVLNNFDKNQTYPQYVNVLEKLMEDILIVK